MQGGEELPGVEGGRVKVGNIIGKNDGLQFWFKGGTQVVVVDLDSFDKNRRIGVGFFPPRNGVEEGGGGYFTLAKQRRRCSRVTSRK